MIGTVVPETCWAYKKYNKIISGIWLGFIFQLCVTLWWWSSYMLGPCRGHPVIVFIKLKKKKIISGFSQTKLYNSLSLIFFKFSKIITSIYQPNNAHIISHKTILKYFKTLRHVSILSDHHQGALFLAKVILQYSQFNSYLQTRCCGSISCCVVEQWLGMRRTTHT